MGVLCYIHVFCAWLCWCICLSYVLRVCELFGETIRNMFWCDCYFVVECYGCVFRELCPVSFLVVGIRPSVLL